MSHAWQARSTLVGVLMVAGGLTLGCNDGAVGPATDSGELTVAAAKALYSGWAPAISVEQIPGTASSFNTAALEGCAFISRDGKMLFYASNRAGGAGLNDIYLSTRESTDDGWGAPVNANDLYEGDATINTAAAEVCPTLARDGHTFYFVSARPGGCGGEDIYVTRIRDDHGFDEPENLGCQINSAGNEASPTLAQEPGAGRVLYFSSNRAGGFSAEAAGAVTGDADIYMSEWHAGAFGPRQLVPVINSASNELQPSIMHDAREIFFISNRPGGVGGNDVWSSVRAKAKNAWSTPSNLGTNVNSVADENRPAISWDGTTLYFGSARTGGEGSSDIYVTTRGELKGSGKK